MGRNGRPRRRDRPACGPGRRRESSADRPPGLGAPPILATAPTGTLAPGRADTVVTARREGTQATPDPEVKAMRIRIDVEGRPVMATLLDNETSRDFASLLPLTLTVKDYADTEKIGDLPRELTTAGAPPGCEPSAGDLAYYSPWGNLAMFLKDFEYSKGLVPLGSLDSGVEALNRRGPLRVILERIED